MEHQRKDNVMATKTLGLLDFPCVIYVSLCLSLILLSFKSIPYSLNLTRNLFLEIRFDESLYFNPHFENLRARALSRLNIIKIFSHKSWHLAKKNFTCIYRALVGSIFDYSFFAVACVSGTSLYLIK